ncbi:hypothetical protein ABI59_11575 [Acidobacteria bacterium Mor1]|nr:hypothetical protein ABI59_11575 [Acidobacteria bacterium Mor1]
MSERAAHDLARLGKALHSLPRLDQALRRGILTWSAAFQVARVARASDEREWVERARVHSVHELKALVRAALATRTGTGTARAEAVPQADDASPESSAEPSIQDLDERTVRKRVQATRLQARCWYAAVELCEQLVAAPMSPLEPPEYLLAEFLSGSRIQANDAVGSVSAGREPSQEKVLELDAERVVTGPTPCVELDQLDVELSPDVSAAFAGLDAEIPVVPHELDRSMRILVAGRRSLDLDLGRLLRNFGHLGLCRQLGFPSLSTYVEERLGISTRKAGLLSRLARGLDRAPQVGRAVRCGHIGVVAALEVCRLVLDSTEEFHWVERARSVSVARLRREIGWGLRRRVLTGGIRRVLPPPRGTLPTELDGVVEELIEARQTFAEGTTTIDENATSSSRNRSAEADDPSNSTTVVMPLLLSMTAYEQWEDARSALSETLDVARPRDCDVLHHVALGFLASYLPEWLVALETSDPIAIREQFRCAAPGCTQRCGAGHHIRFKSQGGSDEAWNLVFLCFEHHILGVHAGVVRVHGRAPDRLVFELGIDKCGTPLETWINGWRAEPYPSTRRDAA